MNNLRAQDKPVLMYFGDPMCSWCYGFSPEFSEAMKTLASEVDLKITMGGLRPYNTQSMTELGEFLTEHWEEVHQRSGQPFSYEILKRSDLIYDTEPACRAVVTVKKMNPALTWRFFKAVQSAFYADNQNPNATATYVALAADIGLDKTAFKDLFESEEMKLAVKDEFRQSANLGVRGFPTVLLQKGEELYLLSNGYVKAADIVNKVQATLQN